jgi:hypothetical protein
MEAMMKELSQGRSRQPFLEDVIFVEDQAMLWRWFDMLLW